MSRVLELLDPQPGQVIVDLTVGRGGHSVEIGRRIGATGTIVGVDLDAGNLEYAADRIGREAPCGFVGLHAPFSDVPGLLSERGLVADALLADLGFASTQIDDAERGLSFALDGPLDMRFDRTSPRTAADLLATLSEAELVEMLRHVGEEPLAPRIAREIVRRRRDGGAPTTTTGLAELVASVYGRRAAHSRLHPATRTFMALRISVNDELNRLSALLTAIAEAARLGGCGLAVDRSTGPAPPDRGRSAWLRSTATIAIIAFHSLEDRLVKHAFAALVRDGIASKLTRKPAVADDAELAENPRSRSAKLRAVRLGVDAIDPDGDPFTGGHHRSRDRSARRRTRRESPGRGEDGD